MALKKQMIKQNIRNLEGGAGHDETQVPVEPDQKQYQRRLAAAIIERMYERLRAAGIPLLIHSIPSTRGSELLELFPLEYFDTSQPGVYFLSGAEVLQPHVGQELLYRKRSHSHWTPYSHEVAAKRLARLVASLYDQQVDPPVFIEG